MWESPGQKSKFALQNVLNCLKRQSFHLYLSGYDKITKSWHQGQGTIGFYHPSGEYHLCRKERLSRPILFNGYVALRKQPVAISLYKRLWKQKELSLCMAMKLRMGMAHLQLHAPCCSSRDMDPSCLLTTEEGESETKMRFQLKNKQQKTAQQCHDHLQA